MGSSRRRSILRRVLAVSAVLLGLVFVQPLGAHTEVFERAPLAGQPVGGTIDRVDISFWESVLSSNIRLAGPDGAEIEVETTELVTGNQIATASFPELTEEGRYTVTHTELSRDGDIQTQEWFFVFDPSAEARFIALADTGGSANWIVLLGASGVVLILAGVLWPKKRSAVSA